MKLRNVILLLLALFASQAYAQRFATVDMKAVTAEMAAAAQVQAAIDEASAKYEAEFGNLREKFKKEFNDYQALDASTPKSIRERRAQELQELDRKMQQFASDAQAELQALREELMAPIDSQIRRAIAAVARSGGYSLIMDVDQPLFIEAVDVTAQVRASLGL